MGYGSFEEWQSGVTGNPPAVVTGPNGTTYQGTPAYDENGNLVYTGGGTTTYNDYTGTQLPGGASWNSPGHNVGSTSAQGYGFNWEGSGQLGGVYKEGNAYSESYAKAAAQLLGTSQRVDDQVLSAYRDLYRSRLGGAAAGQRQFVDQLGAEAAGQGLSGDLVRRMVQSRRAEQAQGLSQVRGETDAAYGMQRANLIDQTGKALAGLTLDELKFGASLVQADQQRKAQTKAAQQAATIGAVGAIAGGLTGGIGLGLTAAALPAAGAATEQ